jgi:MscS family membrane protein
MRARNVPLLRLLLLLSAPLLLPGRAAVAGPIHIPDTEEPHLNEGLDAPPKALDRSTPARAWRSLLDACRASQWDTVVHLINLGDVPKADHKALGSVLASELCETLRTTGQDVRPPPLDDSTVGPIVDDKPRNYAVVAKIDGPEGREELWLRRFRDAKASQYVWLLTRQSVSQIPVWYRRLVKKEAVGRSATTAVNTGLGTPPAALSLSTPHDAVDTFLKLVSGGRYALAAHVLDLSAHAPERQAAEGKRLARRLSIVLHRVHPGGFARLSNDPLGAPEKDVPLDEEVVASTTLDDAPMQLRLARYPIKGTTPVWLFSKATVGDVDGLYQRYGYGWAGDHLPPIFLSAKAWDVQLWQWLGLLAEIALALLLGYFASYFFQRLLLRLASLTTWEWDDALVGSTRGPLTVVLAVVAFLATLPFLALGPAPRATALGLCKLLTILSLGWGLVRVVDVLADLLQRHFKQRQDEMGMTMVPVARKLLKPIIVVIVLVVALQNVGMNVGGLLAGLGIGGLALALAGKNALENLIGSIIISFDRPFKIGDFVKVGDLSGTVEDVGLRSTRLRTLERTRLTIPNAQMADAKVENFAPRDRMRINFKLGLQYDTSVDQLRFIVDELKRYLLAHVRVWQDSFSVRFIGFGDVALQIEVNCYVATADVGEFTGIREAIFFDIGAIVARAGAQFAFPSQTVYEGKAAAADAERARQAATVVAERGAAGELCLPEIPAAVRDRLAAPRTPIV